MTIQRGEIYFVNLNPIQGREQSGKRPVLVLSIDAINKLPLVVTVVIGTKGANTALWITVRDSRILSLPYLPFPSCPRWMSKTLYCTELSNKR